MNSNRENIAIRIFDILVSFTLLILVIPFLFLLCVLIIIFIDMPPFYISHRIGKKGKSFKHFKLKTMLPGVAAGRIFFEKKRLTPLGLLLRSFHLDEIPELFNILKGDMSIVGPRPLPVKLLKGLNTELRNTVLPGWAGLAQLYLTRKGYLDKNLQIYLDNTYIEKRSLIYNIKILCATLSSVLKSRHLNLDPRLTADRRKFIKSLVH